MAREIIGDGTTCKKRVGVNKQGIKGTEIQRERKKEKNKELMQSYGHCDIDPIRIDNKRHSNGTKKEGKNHTQHVFLER